MLIKDWLDKQAVLDNFICQSNGYEDCYSQEFYTKRKLALAVEIGEMANETNCFKYWKKNCEIDRDKLIEEIVDCIHFTLSLINLMEVNKKDEFCRIQKEMKIEFIYEFCGIDVEIEKLILGIYKMIGLDDYLLTLYNLIAIAKYYNYTAEEIVQAYNKKYEENIERQRRNY